MQLSLAGRNALVTGANGGLGSHFAQTLARADWDGERPRLAPIASAVAVHRLREVSCLYGFTRFEAAPTAIDGANSSMRSSGPSAGPTRRFAPNPWPPLVLRA